MSFCAICTDETTDLVVRPLGKDDALVRVCRSCDEDALPVGVDNTRGFEPQGGLLTVVAVRAAKKVVDEEQWARDSKAILNEQRAPGHRRPGEIMPDTFHTTRQVAAARRAVIAKGSRR